MQHVALPSLRDVDPDGSAPGEVAEMRWSNLDIERCVDDSCCSIEEFQSHEVPLFPSWKLTLASRPRHVCFEIEA